VYLNIRQKVIIGFTASVLAVCFIGGFSYHYLIAIELKQRVVQIADDLRENVLEVRRYEKNYLLYGLEEDFKENHRYTHDALGVLARLAPDIKNLRVASQVKLFEQDLLAYHDLMGKLAESMRRGQVNRRGLEDQLRARGKALVDRSIKLVAFERLRILEIIRLPPATCFC